MDTERIEVEHNSGESRFEAELNGKLALLTYRLRDSSIVFLHTEVPPEFEGRGIGGKLARAGLDYARSSALKVVPKCPFIAEYIRRHPEFEDLLA